MFMKITDDEFLVYVRTYQVKCTLRTKTKTKNTVISEVYTKKYISDISFLVFHAKHL